jgi:hypothetical protein
LPPAQFDRGDGYRSVCKRCHAKKREATGPVDWRKEFDFHAECERFNLGPKVVAIIEAAAARWGLTDPTPYDVMVDAGLWSLPWLRRNGTEPCDACSKLKYNAYERQTCPTCGCPARGDPAYGWLVTLRACQE